MMLAVILKGPSEPPAPGALVHLTIEVRNLTDRPLWMVGVLDGSEEGLRYPHYRPGLTSPTVEPSWLRPEPMPLSDMVAPLRLQDFCHLQPGEGFDPTVPRDGAAYQPLKTFASFRPPAPGRYEFRLTLSTDSDQDEEWLGIVGYPGQDEVLKRLAQVPRLHLESNTAIIEVR
ncbi:MAG TPA: hypothetical protein VJ302_24725 [Blastocatellia bacterium]|nr:hypothetical protein [Blastocatellia bacterium]